MPRTVEIPGGQAVLRDPDAIRERHRRLITATAIAASDVIVKLPDTPISTKRPEEMTPEEREQALEVMKNLHLSRQEVLLLDEMQDASILAFLVSWTVADPFPQTIEDVQDMRPALYDALSVATKKDAAEIAAASFAPNPDQSSPTSPSSVSNGSLRDAQKTSSPTSSLATAPINGGGSSPA